MIRGFLLTSLLFQFGQSACNEFPRAQLIQGTVHGTFKRSYGGRIFSSFEGIPFAKPPLGELRFKEPLPALKWKKTLFANRTTKCVQMNDGVLSGSEDCLYLNVYVPKKVINPEDNLDVAVLIFGSSWRINSATDNARPEYIMDTDVIVATMNHRLGILGFLSTQDCIVPGNNALKDQNLAMRWIKENIKSFGGNPNSITLAGFSTGGASVHYHYLSPLSVGFFNRGISLSGTALNPRSLENNPVKKVQKLAKSLECPTDTSENMVKCLRTKPAGSLVNTTLKFYPTLEKGTPKPFLPDHPYKLIKSGKVLDLPWITTNTADEAYFLIKSIYEEKRALEVYNNWIVEGSELLILNETVSRENLVNTLDRLKEKYFGNGPLSEDEAIDRLNRVMTDRHFFTGSDLVLKTQPKVMKSPVYYYISHFLPDHYLQCGGKPTAASHCTDARLLFKFLSNPEHLTLKEEKEMHMLVQLLRTFPKSGKLFFGDVEWLPIDPSAKKIKVLDVRSTDNITMIELDELVSRKFWNSLPIKENDHLY